MWLLPRQHGYLQTHKSSRIASRQATRFRDTFIPLLQLALVSFWISKNTSDDERLRGAIGGPDNVIPRWVNRLLEKGAHPGWVTALRNSQVALFSYDVPRAGVILCPGCDFTNHIPSMAKDQIPFWIQWPSPQSTLYGSPNVCQSYFPSQAEFEAAKKKHGRFSRQPKQNGCVTPLLQLLLPLPLLNPCCLGGKSLSSSSRQRWRDGSSKAHRKTSIAGRTERPPRNTTVVQVPRVPPCSNGDVALVWDSYSGSQCYFSPIDNEWDLCYYMALTSIPRPSLATLVTKMTSWWITTSSHSLKCRISRRMRTITLRISFTLWDPSWKASPNRQRLVSSTFSDFTMAFSQLSRKVSLPKSQP